MGSFQNQGSSPPRSGGEVARAEPEAERGQLPSRRDGFTRDAGYSVLRIWNVDVLREIEAVCATILAALEGHLGEDVIASDMRFVFVPAGKESFT